MLSVLIKILNAKKDLSSTEVWKWQDCKSECSIEKPDTKYVEVGNYLSTILNFKLFKEIEIESTGFEGAYQNVRIFTSRWGIGICIVETLLKTYVGRNNFDQLPARASTPTLISSFNKLRLP